LFDPIDAAMALWAALEAEHAASEAGREFNRVPRPEPAERWSEESKDAFDRQMGASIIEDWIALNLPRRASRKGDPYRLGPAHLGVNDQITAALVDHQRWHRGGSRSRQAPVAHCP
jgi:hypothetical protein